MRISPGEFDALLARGDFPNGERNILERVKEGWVKFEKAALEGFDGNGAVQPSMAVMTWARWMISCRH